MSLQITQEMGTINLRTQKQMILYKQTSCTLSNIVLCKCHMGYDSGTQEASSYQIIPSNRLWMIKWDWVTTISKVTWVQPNWGERKTRWITLFTSNLGQKAVLWYRKDRKRPNARKHDKCMCLQNVTHRVCERVCVHKHSQMTLIFFYGLNATLTHSLTM